MNMTNLLLSNNMDHSARLWFSISMRLLLLLFSMIFFISQTRGFHASGNETDRLALLELKKQITNDPNGIFNNWNDSIYFCNWFGVRCGRRHRDRVTSLVLEGQQLVGTLPLQIGNLSFLREINLQINSLHGEVPQEVSNLLRLRIIRLNNNTLEGEIPVNLSHCSQLRILQLKYNSLVGRIPEELGSLSELEELQLSSNYLTGEISPFLGNLSSLVKFGVFYNMLAGRIPDELGQLKRLTYFSVAINNFSGTIPLSIFNISSLIALSLTSNVLNGSLPENIGITLPKIQALLIGGNKFYGSIPCSVANASEARILDFPSNYFKGQIPTNLGHLQWLRRLSVYSNYLGSNSINDLAFMTSLTNSSKLQLLSIASNHFGGPLPSSIANLSRQLGELALGDNQIVGSIPSGLDNLINLVTLGIEMNHLSGAIPHSLGKLQRIQGLALKYNKLPGQIPSSIGNLSQLGILYLQGNELEGSIPLSLGNCRFLFELDVSSNNLSGDLPLKILALSGSLTFLQFSQNWFSGNLPVEVGKLEHIVVLNISENNLSGEIPETIGDCSSLEFLGLQGNFFQGTIPSLLASLKGLQHLDISHNKLTGQIPKDLQDLKYLSYLNLSFNDLDGEVPTGGIFSNASGLSLAGNNKLCGGIAELQLQKCPTRAEKKGKSLGFKLIVLVICLLLFFAATIFLCFWIIRSKRKSSSQNLSYPHEPMVKVSYKELHQATEGFSSSNLIGVGSFSSVYKGLLGQIERPVAVKVLNLQQEGASKSVLAECNALRNVRHRNLVKLITYCSSLDFKGNEFKALVLDYMENGSLGHWLHNENDNGNQSRNLNLLQRLNIAIDVASALHYLHDLCETVIVHCDLKPGNILLDNEMVAHVSDFGLARLFPPTEDHEKASSIRFKGTIGYAAPEYGIGCPASKEGDVYSYGIVVLEMFTGRRPTSEMFKDGLNLRDFVMAALPGRVVQTVDPTLFNTAAEETGAIGTNATTETNSNLKMDEDSEKCLLSIMEIGVACSLESPEERMKMGDVARKLELLKKAFLGTQVHRYKTT